MSARRDIAMNEPIEHKAPSRFDVSAALPKVARAPAAYPVLTFPNNAALAKWSNSLILLAHPTRFERVTFAFGGQGSITAHI